MADDRADALDVGGVTTVELFFDIVFVFTITQLTTLVAREPDAAGTARALLIFGNLWWMYGGYVWLTNAVSPRATRERVTLLVGMAAFLVCAVAIPDGFGHDGVLLGVGYLVVNVVHAQMLLGPMEGSVLRAMGSLGPANVVTALIVLGAGFADGALQWALWVLAFALHWATPYLTTPTVMSVRAAHFVERHGLIVLIALGESIIAVGAGVTGADIPAGSIVTALVALVVIAAMWWLYFDADDDAARDALGREPVERRAWLALEVYGYGFLVLLAGVIVFAAGVRRSVVRYDHPVGTADATLVAAGAAAYLLALAFTRARLRLGVVRVRVALAALCVPTLFLGSEVSPLAQLAALAVLLTGGIVLEHRIDAAPAPT